MDDKLKLERVVFLDRDGVINQDSPDYIKNCDEFTFLPGSLGAIKTLTENGFHIIVITNQSVINRRMVTQKGLREIFNKMRTLVAHAGGRITDIFFCPHIPEDRCICRKPLPGLIRMACDKYDIDLSRAVMVGDSAKDIHCARAAECGRSILVQTGNGARAEQELAREGVSPDHIAMDLNHAAHWIIKNFNENSPVT